MDILFTFDYEYFIGPETGSFENTLSRPVELLLEKLDKFNVKATFFVDIGYVKRCNELDVDNDNCELYVNHLRGLSEKGHDLQLHIHPHWERTMFHNEKWLADLSMYRLHDFSLKNSAEIIKLYAEVFNKELGVDAKAFRAGGWCLQPFSHISDALSDVGILLDSTVFKGGKYDNGINIYDFTDAPDLPFWKFNDDPLIPEKNGFFTELPIASIRVSPYFFWKLALAQLIGGRNHEPFGDGTHVKIAKKNLLRMLFFPSNTFVSVDGYKATLLNKSYENMSKQYGPDIPMVIIGHPKSLTPFSIEAIEKFLSMRCQSNTCMTISTWIEKNADLIT